MNPKFAIGTKVKVKPSHPSEWGGQEVQIAFILHNKEEETYLYCALWYEKLRWFKEEDLELSIDEEIHNLKKEQNVDKLNQIFSDLSKEYWEASEKFPKFNTQHEGIAIIREEYLELEKEIFKNQKNYDLNAQRKEAIQLAAMNIRLIMDLL